MKKIICIGSATKDIFLPLKEVTVLDTPQNITAKKLMAFEYGAKLYANEIIETVGGSAVNVAAGLTRCGYCTFVFARTSKREIGKWILKQIGTLKIKKQYMQQQGVEESEVSVIILDRKTIEHVILRTGDSVQLFDVRKALKKYNEKVDWIFVGSQKRGWQERMKEICAFSQEKKALIALNPSSYQISQDAQELVQYFSQVEVLFLNRDEAIEIIQNVSGQVDDTPKYLHEKLATYGAKVVVITDGERGAYVGDAQHFYYLPTQAIIKADSVGAGDAFCSGFLAAYIEEPDIKRALSWGIVNSAAAVSKVGGTSGLLIKKELHHQAQEFISKIQTIK